MCAGELLRTWLFVLVAALLFPLSSFGSAHPPSLNVIVIMTDNQGAWSLGCYGNPDIKTPHIDRLANEGVLFTRCFANNAVCSPTRASFLTGLMPCQHGVHRYLSAGGVQTGPEAYNTLAEFDTLPSLLAQEGYVCGLVGKWHLGNNLSPQEGFSYWVTMPHGHTAGFYNQQIIEGGKIQRYAGYLTELWTQRAIEFIETQKDRRFFLFLAYNGPYGLGGVLDEPIQNRHRRTYENAEMKSFPRLPPHPWNHNYANRVGDLSAIRKYAAEISAIDDGVGEIMASLERCKLKHNTLVIFTADQGLAAGHSGFWGMGDHTRPLTAFDWTMHIPLIFWCPDHIPRGRQVDLVVSNVDVLPTLVEYLQLSWRKTDARKLPGRSFAALLRGEEIPSWENVVFYEFENVRAIRTDRWKYIERFRQTPNELYDLEHDPQELTNLVDDSRCEAVKRELSQRLYQFFDKYADPKWDLWRGGTSKSGLLMHDLFDNPGPAPSPKAKR